MLFLVYILYFLEIFESVIHIRAIAFNSNYIHVVFLKQEKVLRKHSSCETLVSLIMVGYLCPVCFLYLRAVGQPRNAPSGITSSQAQGSISARYHIWFSCLFVSLTRTGPQDTEILKNTSLSPIFKPSIPCLGFVWLSYDCSPARHSRLEHQEVHLSEGLTLEVHGGHLLLIDDFNFGYLVKMLLVLPLNYTVSSQNVLLNNIFSRSCMLGKFSIPDLHAQTPKYSWFTNRFLFLTGQLSSVSRSLSEITGRHLAATEEPFRRFFLLTSIFLHLFIIVLNHLVLNVYKICAIRKVPSKLASNGIVTCCHYFLGYVLPGTTWCPGINLYPFCLPWGTSKRTLILATENCWMFRDLRQKQLCLLVCQFQHQSPEE